MFDYNNHFSATVNFTHGQVTIQGTIIFVMAQVAELEKKEGYVSTDLGSRITSFLGDTK